MQGHTSYHNHIAAVAVAVVVVVPGAAEEGR